MTDEEGAEEAIEDLDAPADTQGDVAGGACAKPTGTAGCNQPTCNVKAGGTKVACGNPQTKGPIVYEQ
jgi:hypothetical protein